MKEKFLLGVKSTEVYNHSTHKYDYGITIEVSKDVIDWLENHDVKYDYGYKKIYIVNDVRYVLIDK